jgi:hypothetical protein
MPWLQAHGPLASLVPPQEHGQSPRGTGRSTRRKTVSSLVSGAVDHNTAVVGTFGGRLGIASGAIPTDRQACAGPSIGKVGTK